MVHSRAMLAFPSTPSVAGTSFSRPRAVLAVLAALAIAGYFFFSGGAGSDATFVIAPSDFRQQVSVSGTVVPARDADLGFAANGRISAVYAKVGERVAAGSILAQVENGDLVAALAQKQAALSEAEADLASLKAGTRSEEIAIAAAAVKSAEADLADSIREAYTVSDDAVHNKADTLFTNPRGTNPLLTFTTSNASLKTEVERARAAVEPALSSWKLLVAALSSADLTLAAQQSQDYLAQIAALLADANAAVNQGVPDSSTT